MQDMDRLADLNSAMLPFAKLLGMTFTGAEPGRVTAQLVFRDDPCTQPVVIHDGAILAFADTFGAAAHLSRDVPGRPA
jgi:1,4-dihydroxy-2-naphthoyl-CoA hydrolase